MLHKATGIELILVKCCSTLIHSIRRAFDDPIRIFDEISSSLKYFQEKNGAENRSILIISSIDDETIGEFSLFDSIDSILVFATRRTNLRSRWPKFGGTFFDAQILIENVREKISSIENELDGNSLLFHRTERIDDNPDFYYLPLMKINVESSKKNFVEKARLELKTNKKLLSFVEDFHIFYRSSKIIEWLDRNSKPFPFFLPIQNGLRTHDEKIIGPLQFFLDDLNEKMKIDSNDTKENLVFFGTKLNRNLAERLEKFRQNDVVAFQCFLWTNLSRLDALRQVNRPTNRHDFVKVLFKIRIDNARTLKIGERCLVEAATPFRIEYVSGSKLGTNSNTFLLTVKLNSMTERQSQDLYDAFFNRLIQKEKHRLNVKVQRAQSSQDFESIGDELVESGQWSKAAKFYLKIVEPSAKILNKLGHLYREHLNDPASSLFYHQQALEKVENDEQYETFFNIGKTCFQLKEFPSSLRFYTAAFEYFQNEKEKHPLMISRCLIGLSDVHLQWKSFDAAMKNAEKALKIVETEILPLDKIAMSVALRTIGRIHFSQGENKTALEYVRRSLEILEKNSAPLESLNLLSEIYRSIGDQAKARKFSELALNASKQRKQTF